MTVAVIIIIPFAVSGHDISWMTEDLSSGKTHPLPYSDFSDIMERLTRPGDPVMFISSSVFPAFPVITSAGRRLAGRLTFAFPIAYMYNGTEDYELPPKWKDFESDFLRLLVEDIRKEKPSLLFISTDTVAQALPRGFMIREYLHRRGFDDSLHGSYVPIGSHYRFQVLLSAAAPDSTEAIRYLKSHGLLE